MGGRPAGSLVMGGGGRAGVGGGGSCGPAGPAVRRGRGGGGGGGGQREEAAVAEVRGGGGGGEKPLCLWIGVLCVVRGGSGRARCGGVERARAVRGVGSSSSFCSAVRGERGREVGVGGSGSAGSLSLYVLKTRRAVMTIRRCPERIDPPFVGPGGAGPAGRLLGAAPRRRGGGSAACAIAGKASRHAAAAAAATSPFMTNPLSSVCRAGSYYRSSDQARRVRARAWAAASGVVRSASARSSTLRSVSPTASTRSCARPVS